MEFDKKAPEYQLDIETNLRKYFPTFFELLGKAKISWNSINKIYQQIVFDRMNSMKDENDIITVQANFLDIVRQAVIGNMDYYSLIYFFNSIISDLSDNLDEKEKLLVGRTAYNLLVQPKKYYLNFIGEFAALYKFKNAGYYLFKTEMPLDDNNPGGVKIDFALVKDNKSYLVEVVNVHLPDDFNSYNDEKIIKYITGKIEKKKLTIQSNERVVWLLPIVWSDYEGLKLLDDCLEKYKIKFERTFELNAYMSYSSKISNEHAFKFGILKQLFLTK